MNKEWNEEQRIKDFMDRMPPIISEDLVEYMINNGFFNAPASRNRHGAFEGGNFWHSRMVAMILREYTDKMSLQWERPESPEIIGWLHDLCKIEDYIKINNENGAYHYEMNEPPTLSGHGERSVVIATMRMYLTEEEVHCIWWHMGAFDDKEKWKNYNAAVKKYPNILWVHQADMEASQIKGI